MTIIWHAHAVLSALLVLRNTNAFAVRPSTCGRKAASKNPGIYGIQPDGFGDWMLDADDDYDVNPGPKPRQMRGNSRHEPGNRMSAPPPTSQSVPPQRSSNTDYMSQLEHGTARNPSGAPLPSRGGFKKSPYSPESYHHQERFINQAQGTNTMDYQLEQGIPHQVAWEGSYAPPPPPASSTNKKYYSEEYKQQEEFINKAQGTNTMDYQLERGIPHQINRPNYAASSMPAEYHSEEYQQQGGGFINNAERDNQIRYERSQSTKYYSEEYRMQDEFINRAQGTNRMEYELEKGLPHQLKWVSPHQYTPPSPSRRSTQSFGEDYRMQDEFINKAQGTNRMDDVGYIRPFQDGL